MLLMPTAKRWGALGWDHFAHTLVFYLGTHQSVLFEIITTRMIQTVIFVHGLWFAATVWTPHVCLFVCLLLFYSIATIFQLIIRVIWYMRWAGESLNLHFDRLKGSSHTFRHGTRGNGRWWCCKLYAVGEVDCSIAKCYGSDKIRTPVPNVTNPVA